MHVSSDRPSQSDSGQRLDGEVALALTSVSALVPIQYNWPLVQCTLTAVASALALRRYSERGPYYADEEFVVEWLAQIGHGARRERLLAYADVVMRGDEDDR